jgi:hypothetical protein
MKIISAIGGGGSTFVFRALDKANYGHRILGRDPYWVKNNVIKHAPFLLNLVHFFMRLSGAYTPRLKVLMRPDAFWTDWAFHKTGVHDPNSRTYRHDLCEQKAYILRNRHKRSAGLAITASDLEDDTLLSLVRSYIDKMESIDRANDFTVVLVSGHWGEYGILRELRYETIYLLRDPYNSLISHSKPVRHQNDYLRRGLKHINTKEWIDAYLIGPHHYWVNHARTALSQENAIIIRYDRFADDWCSVKGLPDISQEFVYQENDVKRGLTKESIEYIYEQTKYVCSELGFSKPE